MWQDKMRPPRSQLDTDNSVNIIQALKCPLLGSWANRVAAAALTTHSLGLALQIGWLVACQNLSCLPTAWLQSRAPPA
jgi:hypothetical protein